MATQAIHHDNDHDVLSASDLDVERVENQAAKTWLRQGWKTYAAAPVSSIFYGVLFALACLGTLWLIASMPVFTSAFLTGLVLIGPFLAAGLYVAARQQAAGEPVSILGALSLMWARRTNLALFAVFLGLVMAAWVRLAALIFAVQVMTISPASTSYLGLMSGGFDPIVTGYFFLIGAILAVAVFITSAVAVPLIIDRDAGPILGIQMSWRVVIENPIPMLVWAALIVAMTIVGVLTAFVGMVLIFPVLGYATWHSYKALVH